MIYPDSIMQKNKSIEKIWNERIGNIEDLINGNATIYDILQSVANGNKSKAHAEAAMAQYYDMKVQEQAASERILKNSTEISKKWVENMK